MEKSSTWFNPMGIKPSWVSRSKCQQWCGRYPPVTQRHQSPYTNAATIVHRREDSMRYICRSAISVAAIAAAFFVAAPARAGDDGLFGGANRYLVKNLTSDLPGASNTDPVLQNAWGVTFTPAASPFWISDNATGCSTLYDGVGAIVSLQVK